MIKKPRLSILVVFVFLIMTACSGQREEERVPQFLDVRLSVMPEHGNMNEPIMFTAEIMYGDQPVTDPDEVEFEMWRANDEHHEHIPVEHASGGIYKLEKTFSLEGTYYVYAHVTAESMHAMPKKEFIIGQPSKPEGANTPAAIEEDQAVNSLEDQQ